MLTFNQHGLLVPNTTISSSLSEIEDKLVHQIGSVKRQMLYSGYLDYMAELRRVIGDAPFKQWINGSFSTLTPNPGDIDIVSFINFEVVKQFDKDLRSLRFPASLQFGVDAYIVRVYPPDHRLVALYIGDHAYWMDKFDKTERNRRGLVYPKGFIELAFPDR